LFGVVGAFGPVALEGAGGAAHAPLAGAAAHPAAAHPDHPRTVTVREDTLVGQIRDFFDTRVFGPDRAALLTDQIPDSAAQAAEQHTRQRDRLARELARIDLAQRSQITQIDTLDPDPANGAAQAMRQRCYERFTELQAERETTQTQLDALDHTAARDDDTALLDLIPLLADTIALHPERIQAALYQAFDIQALYKHDMNQVSLFATITTSTPEAVAAILADAGYDPTTTGPAQPPVPADSAPVYPLAQPPMLHVSLPDHETGGGDQGLARRCAT
jgi:hypothetical protein